MLRDDSINPIEYFRLKSAESNSKTSIGNMARAVNSLARFSGGIDLTFDSFDSFFLSEWVASQFFNGYFGKTVVYNLSKIAAMYNKAVEDGIAKPNSAFADLLLTSSLFGVKKWDVL